MEPLEQRQMLSVNMGLGDMAVTGYAADNPDKISFVLLKDVDSGTQFTVTDEGWLGAQTGFRGTGEGETTFQFNSTIVAGTQITLNFTDQVYSLGITAVAGAADLPNLSTNGDSILIYNGGFSNRPSSGTDNNWITGFQMNGNGAWDADAIDSNTSAKPTVFIDGDSSFSGFNPEVDNAVLNNLGNVVGSPGAIRGLVYDSSNWTVADATPPTIPGTTTFYTSIQTAIDAVSSGSTIDVLAGMYTENITLSKSLTLQGAQSGVDARTRYSAGALTAPASETILTAASGIELELLNGVAGSTIDGFAFDGAGTAGNGIRSNGGPLDDLTIQNNVVFDHTGPGVFLNDSGDDITVNQNVFDVLTTGSGTAFHLDTDSFDGLYFTSNNVINADTGLFVDGTRNVGSSTSRDPLFSGNLFQGNAAGANIGRFALENATISNNVFDSNTLDGLQGGPKDSQIVNNQFTNNARAGLRLTGFGGTGDPTRSALGNTVSENIFSGNGSGLAASGYGDVRIDDQEDTTQSTNSFSSNSFGSPVAVFVNETGGAALDFSDNWWGSNVDTTILTKHLGDGAAKIDFTPFLESGADLNSDPSDGFQGDFSEVRVTTLGQQSGVDGRIEEGVNVVDAGGTVHINDGTYVEDVDATGNSAILAPGASPGQVMISGNMELDGDDSIEIEIDGTSPSGPVEFDNFTVTGTATLGGAALSVSGAYFPSPGDQFTIIDTATISGVIGTFSTTSVSLNNVPLTIDYSSGDDVVLVVEPLPEVWVNDDWVITMDIGPGGLSPGDIVESNGLDDDPVAGKVFGYDAFDVIADGIASVEVGGTVHVLAGTYVESLSIDKDVTIDGQGDADVHVDAGAAFTGMEVQNGFNVEISGIELSNFSSTGLHVLGDLDLTDSTVSGGLVGIWVDGGTLNMDSALVSGAAIFGVQVGAGDADITASEITGTLTTAAGVIVSAGHADIVGSKLTSSGRGLLVNATGTASVHGSDLTGNSIAGVVNATGTAVDASANWWGDNTEAGVQAGTVGLVDFTPYLDAGTDTDLGASRICR